MILEGKRILVTGVLNRRSIAFSIAERAQAEGAEVLLTGFGRSKRMTERAAGRLAGPPEVLELDVNDDGSLAALREELRGRWPRVDGAVHAIAFAPADALGGDFLATPRASAGTAFETSAYSFKALADCLEPLMAGGGSLVGLDFDAAVAWPAYDWMGVAKAALESVSRYLARDLGQRGIRVNLLAAGPMRTAAASGIDGFEELASAWPQRAPLGWDAEDPSTVADAALFLLSDLSRATSGEIIHVDGGAHALGQALVY
ncbi:MAG TPA: enoyl-ACP reductase FabI [Solirubrobacterales bacterium]|nr:enoyl-ACP reductase FabI [Solirubrobacterales bacterium]